MAVRSGPPGVRCTKTMIPVAQRSKGGLFENVCINLLFFWTWMSRDIHAVAAMLVSRKREQRQVFI